MCCRDVRLADRLARANMKDLAERLMRVTRQPTRQPSERPRPERPRRTRSE